VPWYFAVIESQHELQNPTSVEKIRLLGERLRLTPGSHVLDIASGTGGPALVLAESFGCRVTCVEKAEEFVIAARRRVLDAGLDSLIELVHSDVRSFPIDEERYDAALCLGASFVWDNLAGTLDALRPTVRPGGSVAVGEPYWRTWPLPKGYDVDPEWAGDDYVTLGGTIERFRRAGLDPLTIIDSSLDDWDRYESLHWLVAEEWLGSHPDDKDSDEIRSRMDHDRDAYLRWQRDLLGWAIIAGRNAVDH
jgi:SAM-dependent methyltransferase